MRKYIFLLLLININITAYNQVIKGTVLDKQTKKIINFASVYFNGTFVGSYTDTNGNFEINVSKNKLMPLSVSALGYFSTTVADLPTDKTILIYLEPKVFELDEVVINAKSYARKRKIYLRIFKNEFLGTTSNALNCVITNENDIKFDYEAGNDTVKAFASAPILIENRSLGYNITYYLDKFEYYKSSSSFSFQGNIIFKEDLTADETQQQIFVRRRKNAYLGSRMQFFRALWLDDLNSTGFTVKNSSNETLSNKKIVYQENSRTKYLKYPGGLSLCYYSKVPTSFIVFQKERVYFNSDGYFDPDGITWEGNMAQLRIADWLPYEYIFMK
jgi:hypothetical protein